MREELIFVYNANSDLFSTVTDFAHKIFSPSTYQCQLCALTYGSFTVKQEWKSFIKGLPMQSVFLYKDGFKKQHKIEPRVPAVFVTGNGAVEEIITKQEIESCQSLQALKNLITEKLKEYVQHHHSNI